MDLHPDHAIQGNERAIRSSVRCEELHLLDRAREILREGLEPEAGAELNLGSLLVQDEIRGWPDLVLRSSPGPDEAVTLLATKPNFAPLSGETNPVGSVAEPAILPAVSNCVGLKPTLLLSEAPLPIHRAHFPGYRPARS